MGMLDRRQALKQTCMSKFSTTKLRFTTIFLLTMHQNIITVDVLLDRPTLHIPANQSCHQSPHTSLRQQEQEPHREMRQEEQKIAEGRKSTPRMQRLPHHTGSQNAVHQISTRRRECYSTPSTTTESKTMQILRSPSNPPYERHRVNYEAQSTLSQPHCRTMQC